MKSQLLYTQGIKIYSEHLNARNMSKSTVYHYTQALKRIGLFLKKVKSGRTVYATGITESDIRKIKSDFLYLAPLSLEFYMRCFKRFMMFLEKENHMLINPMRNMVIKKSSSCVSDRLLTQKQIREIMNSCDTSTLLGLRDRTMFEVFYSTGIRRKELVNLDLFDVDLKNEYFRINLGKGRKDRIIPVGRYACKWINRYLLQVRPLLMNDSSGDSLFLDNLHSRITDYAMGAIFRRYSKKLGYPVSPHRFRHTFATALLRGGAEIRYVQGMLGHADIGSTEVYLSVTGEDLKEAMKKHPRSSVDPDSKKKNCPSKQAGPSYARPRKNHGNRTFPEQKEKGENQK